MLEKIRQAVNGDEGVAGRLHAAILDLLHGDEHLLRYNANERSITHRLAMYMQTRFPDWDVDAEYNRNHEDAKVIPKRIPNLKLVPTNDDEGQTVFPDIIVHLRGTRENLLVLEIKKSSNPEPSAVDLDKLARMMGPPLEYRHAVFIRFGVGGEERVLEITRGR